jgi:RES domain-containing protein
MSAGDVAGGKKEPAAAFPYLVERIALERTVRLVTTARLRDPVLLKLVGRELFADLAEIEGATSGRLTAEQRGADAIGAGEFIVGPPHAAFINAAFAYWRPRELNRFNGPGRGAWYAALAVETCIEEVAFHLVRELERVNYFNAVVDYAEMFASFAGEFTDLRHIDPRPPCLDPDTAIAYPLGNALAEAVRERGYNGIIYPSVRHTDGTCVVALWPHTVQSVAQGRVLRLTWAGQRAHACSIVAGE